jgi:hypothetical protein
MDVNLRDRTQAVATGYESGLVTPRSREQRLSDEQLARIVWGLPS